MQDKNVSELDRIRIGDVMISHKGRYHYIVESILGNDIVLSWLERVDEPIDFYPYHRVRKLDGISSHYDLIPCERVDWSKYKIARNRFK